MKFIPLIFALVLFSLSNTGFNQDQTVNTRIDQVTPEGHSYPEVKRCIDCKADGKQMMMRAAGVKDISDDIVDHRGWLASAHSKSAIRPETKQTECATCHDPLQNKEYAQGVTCNACHPSSLSRELRYSLVTNYIPGTDPTSQSAYVFHDPKDPKARNQQCQTCHSSIHHFSAEIKNEQLAEGTLRCIDCHMAVFDSYNGQFDERLHNLEVTEAACSQCHSADEIDTISLEALIAQRSAGKSCHQFTDQLPIQATLYEPGIFSTFLHEHSQVTFSPDGTTALWSVGFPDIHTILISHRTAHGWTDPEVAPFSGFWWDDFPTWSPFDGALYFASKRPGVGESKAQDSYGLWKTSYIDRTWTEPQQVKELIPDKKIIMPCFTTDGTLYFFEEDESGYGGWDIYRAKYRDGKYSIPELLDNSVNSDAMDGFVYVTPDDSTMIYTRFGTNQSDSMMISIKNDDGNWQPAIAVGDLLTPNLNVATRFYSLSPDKTDLIYNAQYLNPLQNNSRRLTLDDLKAHFNRIENGGGNYYTVELNRLLGVIRK